MDGRHETQESIVDHVGERIVVGTDGSPAALPAVRWAAEQARTRGLGLDILHAAPQVAVVGAGSDDERVRRILGTAADVARFAAPDVAVSLVPTSLDPIEALLSMARTAQLLVVGGPGHGALEFRHPSVAMRLADRAECPVVVVRDADRPAGGYVLVGVDDPALDIAALATAFAEADRQGSGLVVLHAQGDALGLPRSRRAPDVAAGRLAAVVGALAARYPGVAVEVCTPHREPAPALRVAARRARLVVVGTRTRGPVARMVLGSPGHALLRHSPVPVLVVGPRVDPSAAETPASAVVGGR